VPTDAPPLVIAIPGPRNPAADELVSIVADAVSMSCPNATIRAGYLDGESDRLDNLLQAGPPDDSPAATAVVIPLLTGPNPRADAALAEAVAGATVPVIATDHLGPHPLIAEAVHARLADSGLARASRVRGLSIANSADGIIVLADRGEEAEHAAGVVAVLLSSRLAIPAAPASVGDRVSLDAAITRLRDSHASMRCAPGSASSGPSPSPGTRRSASSSRCGTARPWPTSAWRSSRACVRRPDFRSLDGPPVFPVTGFSARLSAPHCHRRADVRGASHERVERHDIRRQADHPARGP
jgi:sirohydrochlorin ferrochelatase